MNTYADLIERLRDYQPCLNPETAICDRPTVDAAADAISRLEREKAEAEKRAFNHGYLIATANIMNLHGEEVIAGDVLDQLGVSADEIRAMDLSEYDMDALEPLLSRTQEPPHAHKDA